MRCLSVAALLLGGCTVDLGAGHIAPLAIDEALYLVDAATSGRPAFSLKLNIEFLAADAAATIDDNYGNKINAIEAVDLDIQELDIRDASGTAILAGLTLRFVLDHTTVDESAVGTRVRLPAAATTALKTAIHTRSALIWPVTVTLRTTTPYLPPTVDAHALLQPIAVINPFKAL